MGAGTVQKSRRWESTHLTIHPSIFYHISPNACPPTVQAFKKWLCEESYTAVVDNHSCVLYSHSIQSFYSYSIAIAISQAKLMPIRD